MDYSHEIKGLKALLAKEQKHYREVCRQKADALTTLQDLEKEEIETNLGVQGLMIAIDELSRVVVPSP